MVKRKGNDVMIDLNYITERIKDSEKKRGWDNTTTNELLSRIGEEIGIIKRTTDKDILDNKVTDVFILSLQLAIRNNVNLESEFRKHVENWDKKYPVIE